MSQTLTILISIHSDAQIIIVRNHKPYNKSKNSLGRRWNLKTLSSEIQLESLSRSWFAKQTARVPCSVFSGDAVGTRVTPSHKHSSTRYTVSLLSGATSPNWWALWRQGCRSQPFQQRQVIRTREEQLSSGLCRPLPWESPLNPPTRKGALSLSALSQWSLTCQLGYGQPCGRVGPRLPFCIFTSVHSFPILRENKDHIFKISTSKYI